MSELVLVTGGVRSGKSSYAQRIADSSGLKVFFIATAEELDGDMKKRIRAHKGSRPDGWVTIEEPLKLNGALKSLPSGKKAVIVDCLTLLISNLLEKGKSDDQIISEIKASLKAARAKAELTVIVTNEVGSGIVPLNALSRRFRDLQGKINQIAAKEADRACLLVSGIPVNIK